MLSSFRKMSTSCATAAAATAACTAIMLPFASTLLSDPFLATAASSVGGSTAIIIQEQVAAKKRRYKQWPPPPSDSIEEQPPPPIAKTPLSPTDIVWPENDDIDKTKRVLIVPEGYDAETLASAPFRAALQRYQHFLQQHFPTELITVGISYPKQSIPSVTPDAKRGHLRPTEHPLLAKTDGLLILLNGEQHRLKPHADCDYRTAVSWGPSVTGVVDFERLVNALHECLHLCSTSSEHSIHDSYAHDDLSLWTEAINSFNHSGFLPYVSREEWPDTPVTLAIKVFNVPVYRYTQDGKEYWAVSNRANVMDYAAIIHSPVDLAAFLLTGGKLVERYQQRLVFEGAVEDLEKLGRITPDKATELREKFSLDYIKANEVSLLYYLAQSVKDR